MKEKIEVMLVDDHPLMLDGVKGRLEENEGIRVVGTVEDGRKVEAEVERLQPDIVFMDVSLPGTNGLDLTKMLRERWPQLAVIVLSMHDNREYVRRAVDNGASGYILKNAPSRELVEAVEAVMKGEHYFSAELSQKMVSELLGGEKAEERSVLTPRQREVLIGIASGKTSKEIAEEMGISARTAETHRDDIMKRLRIHTVAGLTRYAVKKGMVTLD